MDEAIGELCKRLQSETGPLTHTLGSLVRRDDSEEAKKLKTAFDAAAVASTVKAKGEGGEEVPVGNKQLG